MKSDSRHPDSKIDFRNLKSKIDFKIVLPRQIKNNKLKKIFSRNTHPLYYYTQFSTE